MITTIIVALTCVVSLISFKDKNLEFNKLIYSPRRIVKFNEYWRLFSYSLLHNDFVHLVFNMLALYSFGIVLEQDMGSALFTFLYLSALPISLIYNLYKNKNSYSYVACGASGSVSAVIYSFVLLHPTSLMLVFFIPMPAWLFGVVYLGLSYWMIKSNRFQNVGHDVHITGAVYGLLLTLILMLFKLV